MALALPDALIWSDEFAWQQVEQSGQYTTTGALILDVWPAKQAGRPMTLAGDVTYGWILRGTLNTLNNWAAQPGLQMQLTRMGETHHLVWDHDSGAIEATPVIPYSDPIDSDYYSLTLRFLIL